MSAPRPWLAPAALTLVLLAAAVPLAEAGPLPQTEKAVRHVVRDTLHESDKDAARLVREAHALVPRPLVPGPSKAGGLEVLATFTQPAVRGQDDLLAAVWLAPTGASWTGAYWVESGAGSLSPRTMTVGSEGALLTLYGGSLALGAEARVTFHFLGPNQTLWSHEAPAIAVLAETPTTGGADFGGAVATRHGRADLPELLFLTPWNLVGHDAPMGFTLRRADGSTVEAVLVGGCADAREPISESGCRALYIVPRGDVATVAAWTGEAPATGGDKVLLVDDLLQEPYTFA